MGRKKEDHSALGLVSRHRGEIMGFAALCIIIFHEWITLSDGLAGAGSLSIINTLEVWLKRFGFFGVDIFFFLSGIGLTFSIVKTGVGRFYYNRFKRVFLPFLIVAIGRAILEHWPVGQFVGNITGWNFYAHSMYSFLWFVPAIMTFYIFFPLYYKIFDFAPHKGVFTFAIVLLWLFASIKFKDIMREDLFGFTNRIPVFITGVYAGYLTREKKGIEFKWYHWILTIAAFALGFFLAVRTNFHDLYLLVPVSNSFLPNFLMAISVVLLLAKAFDAFSKNALGRGFCKIFGFFGMFSLEFYCVQEWLGGLIIPRIWGMMPPIAINATVIAASTIIGIAIYYFQKAFWKAIDSKV